MLKIALFAFNGDAICFIHVLLNALDMHAQGVDSRMVVEGAATRLVAELAQAEHPLHTLWEKAKAAGRVDGVCKACAHKMGSLESAQAQGLTLLDEMNGHPSMARYRQAGFEIITF